MSVLAHSALPQKGLPEFSMIAEISLVPIGLAAVPQYPVESSRHRSSAPLESTKVVVFRNLTFCVRMRVAFAAYCPEFLLSVWSVWLPSSATKEADVLVFGYIDVLPVSPARSTAWLLYWTGTRVV